MQSATLIFSRPSIMAISLMVSPLFTHLDSEYSPPGACSADHVEVVARLRRRVWIDGFHQLLENHQGRQAARTAAVEREQPELAARHGVYVSNGKIETVLESSRGARRGVWSTSRRLLQAGSR
jgi:hypothetical protein